MSETLRLGVLALKSVRVFGVVRGSPSSGLWPPSPIRWEKEFILWDDYPG